MIISRYSNKAVAIVCLLCSTTAATAQTAVEKVLLDWERRSQRASSFYYEIDGYVTFTKGHITRTIKELLPPNAPAEVPADNVSAETKIYWTIDLDKNWVRKERWAPIFHTGSFVFESRYELCVYDGSQYKSYKPREKNTSPTHSLSPTQPDLVERTLKADSGLFFPVDFPMFFAHGIVAIPGARTNLEKIRSSRIASEFQDAGVGIKDGRRCVILRTLPKGQNPIVEEIWADPDRESAIVFWKRTSRGKTSQQSSIEYEVRDGAWLPKEWTNSLFDPDEQLGKRETLTVRKLVLNPRISISDFQVIEKSGMVVLDKKGRSFLMTSFGGKEEIVDGKLPTNTGLSWIQILLILGGITLIAFFVRRVFLWRKQKAAT